MAKNDALEMATLTGPSTLPGGSAQYMRKDSMMLVEGVWYITTPCRALAHGLPCLAGEGKSVDVENGLVDEEVPWAQAKTPHHAGLIADRRHIECSKRVDDALIEDVRKQEIEAAEDLLKHAHFNRDQAAKRFAEIEAARPNAPDAVAVPEGYAAEVLRHERELEAARLRLSRYEMGLEHAHRRVKETRAQNDLPPV